MTFEPAVPDHTAQLAIAAALIDQAHLAAEAVEASPSDEDKFPVDALRALAAHGLLTAPLPPGHGGCRLGTTLAQTDALRIILARIGRADLALGRLYEGHVNALALACRYGTDRTIELLATEAHAGRISGVWMAGESLSLVGGSDDRWHLKGRKILCSGAGFIRRPLAAAELPDAGGSIMVLPQVDTASADCSAWTPLGMRATATGTVDFDGVEIAPSERIGVPGDYLRSPHFQGGAWRVIAVQLGGLQAIMAAYKAELLASRHTDHPLQLARYGEALIAAETAELWVTKAAQTAERPFTDAAAIDAYVNLARNAFERAAFVVISAAQKAIGLRAFLQPNRLERVVRDLETYLRQPGLDPSLVSAASYDLRAPAA